jgi:hypothetical protein
VASKKPPLGGDFGALDAQVSLTHLASCASLLMSLQSAPNAGVGMIQWVSAAGDLASAATALGGLLLVFIGMVASGFGSYDTEDQSSVRKAFLVKGGFALAGFILALIAAALALGGKLTESACLVKWACASLAVSFIVAAIAAILSVWEMK